MKPPAKADWKFMKPDPDPGFDPIKNKMVIERTIRNYDKLRKMREKMFRENIGERVDVLSSWVKSIKGQNKPIDRYITKKYMTELAGEKIMSKLERLKKFRAEHPNILIS